MPELFQGQIKDETLTKKMEDYLWITVLNILRSKISYTLRLLSSPMEWYWTRKQRLPSKCF